MTESARLRTRPQMYSGGIFTPDAYLRSGNEMAERAGPLLVLFRGANSDFEHRRDWGIAVRHYPAEAGGAGSKPRNRSSDSSHDSSLLDSDMRN